MSKRDKKKSILAFKCYRKFLQSYFDYKKAIGPYSLTQLSEELGLSSPNYAGLILKGKRNLQLENLPTMHKLFAFTEEELKYAHLLISHNNCKDKKLKASFEQWMDTAPRPKVQSVSPQDFGELIYNGQIPIIYACLDHKYGQTLAKLGELCKFPVSQIKQNLDFLVARELISKIGNEYYALEKEVTDASFMNHFNFEEFQKEQLKLSLDSLQNNPQKNHKFATSLFLVDEKGKEKILDEIRELLVGLSKKQRPNHRSRLLQLNIQILDR